MARLFLLNYYLQRDEDIDQVYLREQVLKDDESSDIGFEELVKEEADHDIKFRTLSWHRTTFLLFGEYVCLAILALPWSFSVLGWGTGLVVQIGTGFITWYTSYILWRFCMKYPKARDIGDIAAALFPACPRFAREASQAMLVVNSVLGMGFHVFTGAKIFNTLTDNSLTNPKVCSVVYHAVTAILSALFSIPRTLNHVSLMSTVSATAMAISIVLCLVYCGIQDHPWRGYGPGGNWAYYPEMGPVKTSGGFPNKALSFVDGFNAVLNLIFLWIGQLLYPSFIAEMRDPKEFPKALACLTAMEMVLFTIVSVVCYRFLGQYAQAPVMASLQHAWMRKSSYALALVPTIFIGVIYCNVTVKVVYNRILGKSRHAHSHTFIGWGTWIAGVCIYWALAFVFGNVIPSMGDFLSILAGAFDSFFGYIYWAVAFYRLHQGRGRFWSSPLMIAQSLLNIFIFLFGLMMLGPGLYTSITTIIKDYSGPVSSVFNCDANGL